MTHRISPDDHYVESTSVEWALEIVDDNGDPKNLTGASAEWYLVENQGDENSSALLDHTDSGVSISVDESTSTITLEVDRGTTENMDGDNWHRFIIDDLSNGRIIYHGPFPIEPK